MPVSAFCREGRYIKPAIAKILKHDRDDPNDIIMFLVQRKMPNITELKVTVNIKAVASIS